MIFRKFIDFTDKVTAKSVKREAELQTVAFQHEFTPRIIDILIGHKKGLIEMDQLGGDNLFELYGDDPNDTPTYVWEQIWKILNTLYTEEGIEYIDITPFNFIQVDKKVYIIDFGHAYYTRKGSTRPSNWFLREFLEGKGGVQKWNPDFR